MPSKTNISLEMCVKAAEWWAQFLPVIGEKAINPSYIDAHLYSSAAQKVAVRAVQNIVSDTRDAVPAPVRDKFVRKLTSILFASAEISATLSENPDQSVTFGSIGEYFAPREVRAALEEVGLDNHDTLMPSKVEMTLQANGIIDINKFGQHEYLYTGPGQAPVLLSELSMSDERIESAALVMIKGAEYIYYPV